MSNVQTYFTFNGNAATGILSKITNSSVTTVIDATKGQVNLVELYVIENAGSTPNLTVDIYDGTNAYPLPDSSKAVWSVKAVSANQAVEFSSRVIPKGSILRVTSSDALGKFNIIGTKVSSGRTPIGGP